MIIIFNSVRARAVHIGSNCATPSYSLVNDYWNGAARSRNSVYKSETWRHSFGQEIYDSFGPNFKKITWKVHWLCCSFIWKWKTSPAHEMSTKCVKWSEMRGRWKRTTSAKKVKSRRRRPKKFGCLKLGKRRQKAQRDVKWVPAGGRPIPTLRLWSLEVALLNFIPLAHVM